MDLADLVRAVVSGRASRAASPVRAGRRVLRAVVLLGAVGAAAGGPAAACGLEDPDSLTARRGALALAFPGALHVGTAIWKAQLAGQLPRDAIALRDDLAPEARAQLRRLKAGGTLERVAARLALAGRAPPAGFAIVLAGPVLWSRVEQRGPLLRVDVHVDGPSPGDVVAVTDLAAVEAIADGTQDVATALARGHVRLYGAPAPVASMRAWLASAGGA